MRSMLVVLVLVAGCNQSHSRLDAGAEIDAGRLVDAGRVDAGRVDASVPRDAHVVRPDAGPLGCVLPEPEEHRASGAACPTERPLDPIDPADVPDFSTCSSHEECTDGINGRCTGNSFHGYDCSYDRCFSDDECTAGPCLCRDEVTGRGPSTNHCLDGNCGIDAHCGEGGFCSPTLGSCGDFSGVVGYYCHTCDDECTNDSDCPNSEEFGFERGYCAFDTAVGRWRCQNVHCAG